jgi:L,D-transpeptidase ErfK/SrfK
VGLGSVGRAAAAVLLATVGHLHAEQFALPPEPQQVVGQIGYTRSRRGETLLEIARRFDLGHDQIVAANPLLNRWLPPAEARVLLPSHYVLPTAARRGIVLNLAELRLYYYPADQQTVYTYPVSIGVQDWRTPLGQTVVTGRERNPSWTPPPSIRAEHQADGEQLPAFIPGGHPDNPLGRFALKLSRQGYLIHGTDERRALGIGMRVSHGCIRLYPEDIEELFTRVAVGTPVTIVDQPVKVGWDGGQLWLQVHYPVDPDEQRTIQRPNTTAIVAALERAARDLTRERADGAARLRLHIPAIRATLADADGVATAIGWLERR